MAAAANRDSSPPVEDDGSLSVTAGLAKEAALLFQAGKYEDCLTVLNQLLQKKEGDPKILHNIAIVESFQDGCTDPKRLLEILLNVKKRSEELAYASAEHVDAVGNLGKAVIGTKGTNTVTSSSSSPMVYNDEFDTSVTMFNIAVTWFHLHEYDKAISTLELLYQNIQPIDEGTALRICLLFLDVALFTHHTTRAADVINYVEKVFGANNLINQVDSGNSSQQQSSSLVPKSSSALITEGSSSDSATIVNPSDSPLSRTLSEDTEYDNLLSTLDISGQNLQRPSVLQSSADLSKTQAEELISVVDLRLKLHLYKVQLFLLARNPKAAKREVKMAMNMARGKDYTMALFLKSQLEYARGNHKKAIKLLLASSNRNEPGTSSLYYNNLGCIHFQLGKPNTSAVFFSKALNSSAPLRKENPLKLSTFSQDKSNFIAYNCGIQYLACGKPIPAARCFIKASFGFSNQPLLWLRLAECCIIAHDKGLINSGMGLAKELEVNLCVIGEGKYRKLVIEEGSSKEGQENKQPNLSMSLARQYLRNALYLLDSSESAFPTNSALDKKEKTASGEAKEQKIASSSLNATLQSSTTDHAIICKKEHQMLKQALLADLAFVELELENPLKALGWARSLLKLTECSRMYVFLGNIYAAEALLILSRSKEAVEHLSIYLNDENEFELPYGQEDFEPWRVDKPVDPRESKGSDSVDTSGVGFLRPDEARGTLYGNMAAAAAMLGDILQAQIYVKHALRYLPNNRKAVLTATYIDLMQGKNQEALVKLKECSHVRIVSGSVKLNAGGS